MYAWTFAAAWKSTPGLSGWGAIWLCLCVSIGASNVARGQTSFTLPPPPDVSIAESSEAFSGKQGPGVYAVPPTNGASTNGAPASLPPTSAKPAETGLTLRGDVVWRFDVGEHRQAYVFEGACQVEYGTQEYAAERILAVVERRRGRAIRVALLWERGGKIERHSVLSLRREPQFSAPRYRGRPEQVPPEIAALDAALGASQVDGTSQVAGAAGPNSEQAGVARAAFMQGGVSRSQPGARVESLPAPNGVNLPEPMPLDTPPAGGGSLGAGGMQFMIGGNQALELVPRGGTTPAELQTRPLPETGELAVVVRGGATALIRDVSAVAADGTLMELGTISLSANSIVGWLPATGESLFGAGSSLSEAQGELYLEGDIVFRQGERVIYADRMYYNIAGRYGMILAAEAITTIPEYQGYVRLKADVLQQVTSGRFLAFGAAVTSSRLGVPRYWLQSDQVEFTDTPATRFDPMTGQNVVESVKTVSSKGNTVFIGGFPVLYWPVFSSNLEKTNFYLTGLKVKRDSIFGTQVMADFDMFQLLGVDLPPDGIDWTLSTDYLSERGPAIGTKVNYATSGALGMPGPVIGLFDAWAIYDEGRDNLGSDRRDLLPERDVRGRMLMRHRHYLPYDMELIAEVGLLSDRDFLEQYLENEWDNDKDHDTELRLRKYYLNNLFDLHAAVRLNEFYTETNRLPQIDHYNMGSAWFGGRVNWSAHNRVGYSKLEVADAPEDPGQAAKFTTLPGEFEREGLVAFSRQELAAPFQLGVFKLVPFVSGEAGYWGEAVDGEDLTRLLGQAGVRGTLPAWRLYPNVSSSLFNIRGLAHKAEWRGEIFYADSTANLDELPLYDPLDDDAQEQFRRRLIFNTFGGAPLLAQYDPRTFAFRNGLQRYVASPSAEIADDTLQARAGLHQRWQTKRGLPGRERIVDLVRFDVTTAFFFNEDQENFGEAVGPTRYDFRYHAGDRVTFLSDGYIDWWEDGLRSISAGVSSSRPGLGDAYLGIMSLEGPISSTVLRGQIDYRLNEKWITSAGATFDLGDIGNVGQQLALTRVGESLLLRLGITVDAGRDNVGFQFMLEPRFWPGRRMGQLGGQYIPPPGVEGLE